MRRKPQFIPASLKTQFKAIGADVMALMPKGSHVNHVVIDPALPDPEGMFPGLPIYTGQSADMAQRILAHLGTRWSPRPIAGSSFPRWPSSPLPGHADLSEIVGPPGARNAKWSGRRERSI